MNSFHEDAADCRFALHQLFCTTCVIDCNFLKEVRLGGRGSEGPKGPTLGRQVSACATILGLFALLYLRASH